MPQLRHWLLQLLGQQCHERHQFHLQLLHERLRIC